MLTVAVIGVVEARRDGVPLTLPRGKSTELLVRLAFDVGGCVRTDTLLEDLWGEPAARNTLQSKVSQLRRAIGTDVVEGAAGGYTLTLDRDCVDAFQVSATGDIANWHTGEPDAIPAVGGAMDLAAGARQVFVTIEHLTKDGKSKIVERCSYPLTGVRCVTRIYTDLAVIQVQADGLQVADLVEGLAFEELQRLSGVPLRRLATAA